MSGRSDNGIPRKNWWVMILVEAIKLDTITDVKRALQRAVQLEFATLPPYLYAWYTVGDNAPARSRILDVIHEEMIHMMLACNILNALGGAPLIADAAVVPTYPGPLPFAIGSQDGEPFKVHLFAFSEPAMQQAAKIEEPEDPLDIRSRPMALAEPEFHTIGEFYDALALALPPDGPDWNPVNQIEDSTAFAGELFAISGRADAQKAIERIVSQGEGTSQGTEGTPLDFEGEVSHYYRFTGTRCSRRRPRWRSATGGGLHSASTSPRPPKQSITPPNTTSRMIRQLRRRRIGATLRSARG